jgi:YVTN family beta-propeller protein
MQSSKTASQNQPGRYLARLRALSAVLFGLVLAASLQASTVRVYIVNDGGTTISIIDPATNTVVGAVHDVEGPETIHFSPDGSQGYIAKRAESILNILDTKTGKIIKRVPLSGRPDDLAVTPDGKLVAVNIQDKPGALDIVDAKSLENIKTIPTPNGQWLHDVIVTKDSKYAIAGQPDGDEAVVFDLVGQKVAFELPLDEGIMPLEIQSNADGSGKLLFLQLRRTNGFAVFDFAKRTLVAKVNFPEVQGGFKLRDAFSHGMALSPDGKTLLLASRPNNAIYAYSLPDLKLLGSVQLPEIKLANGTTLGASPNWIAFTPDGKLAYISNTAANSVSVIDAEALKLVTNIPVGEAPGKIGVLLIPSGKR